MHRGESAFGSSGLVLHFGNSDMQAYLTKKTASFLAAGEEFLSQESHIIGG
jgi:hypothetical protein